MENLKTKKRLQIKPKSGWPLLCVPRDEPMLFLLKKEGIKRIRGFQKIMWHSLWEAGHGNISLVYFIV